MENTMKIHDNVRSHDELRNDLKNLDVSFGVYLRLVYTCCTSRHLSVKEYWLRCILCIDTVLTCTILYFSVLIIIHKLSICIYNRFLIKYFFCDTNICTCLSKYITKGMKWNYILCGLVQLLSRLTFSFWQWYMKSSKYYLSTGRR